MAISYPPVSFYFQVEFSEIGDQDADIRFQSVSGLSVDMQTDTIKEGGENRFEHILPVRSNYQNLTLKRGLIKDSKIITWCTDAFQNLIIRPVDMTVSLKNPSGNPLMTWNIKRAWPKKWGLSDLNAEQNGIAIETFELEYQYFTLILGQDAN
ncbi:MAG: phage tail protein [Bacteroidota bacterium]